MLHPRIPVFLTRSNPNPGQHSLFAWGRRLSSLSLPAQGLFLFLKRGLNSRDCQGCTTALWIRGSADGKGRNGRRRTREGGRAAEVSPAAPIPLARLLTFPNAGMSNRRGEAAGG